ncbi:MAG TPA: DUF1330 domain-containing protein [Dehalococcoidia bacterium]|nr:DUF1330 domain-containing protein [Dehalococcoidia bacterium]
MAVYVMGTVEVIDPERFAPYMEKTPEIIARHGGEVIDIVEAYEVLEGAWPAGAVTAIVRFPDDATARAFWADPDNVAMKDLRHETSRSNVALFRSVPPPTS